MAESRALSQWEIDALLNQIPEGSGEAAGPEAGLGGLGQREGNLSRAIKTYDFRRPDKFSKEQWQTLQAMHETFARLIGASFSSRLRSLVTTRLSSIEQGLYEEWQVQVPTPTACYVIALPPLAGSIVVEFNQDVAAEVVDRLLGGTGSLIERGRELTEIEMTLLRTFASAITSALQDMWEKVSPVKPELQDLGLDASVIQIAGPNDVVVTAFFEVNLGSHLGAMSLCLPYTVVEPIVGNLSAQVWHSSSPHVLQDDRTRRRVEAVLRLAPVEVDVELGSIELPARAVVELEEGDTLVLDAPVDRPLSMNVGGFGRFFCRPGVRGNHVAVSVTEVVVLPQDPSEAGDAAPPETPAPPDEAAAPALDGAPSAPALAAPATVPPPATVIETKEAPGA